MEPLEVWLQGGLHEKRNAENNCSIDWFMLMDLLPPFALNYKSGPGVR